MSDYIERKDALDAVQERFCDSARILEAIENLPSADVRQVVRSKWVQLNRSQEHYCENCGVTFNLYAYCKNDYNFCPSCGADMRGE